MFATGDVFESNEYPALTFKVVKVLTSEPELLLSVQKVPMKIQNLDEFLKTAKYPCYFISELSSNGFYVVSHADPGLSKWEKV